MRFLRTVRLSCLQRAQVSLSVQMDSRDMTWPMIEEAFSLHPNCPVTPLWYQAFTINLLVCLICVEQRRVWSVWCVDVVGLVIKYFHVHGHWPILDHSFFFEV